MSTHRPDNGHGHAAGPPQPGHGEHGGEDEIDFGKVIAVGVVSLAIFAAATYWAAVILKRETTRIEERTGQPRPAKVGLSEIGIVDQVPFADDNRLDVWQKEHAARLGGYGWVDRAKGIAHVPIDKAMEAVAGGALPAGAPR